MGAPVVAEEVWNESLAARWEAFDSGGWECLLPRAPGARWLCFDSTGGATATLLAGVVDDVTVVPVGPGQRERIATRLSLLALPNVRLAPEGLVPTAAPGGVRFDGAVLHDLGGALGRAEVWRALATAREAVAVTGCIYVALRNRYGYPRIMRPGRELFTSARTRYFRPREVTAALAGRPATVHPCISNGKGRLLDVITPSGYVSAQNPDVKGERLRRALLGPRGAPLIAPSFLLLTRGAGGPSSTLEDAVAALESRRGAKPGSFMVRRYHCLRGGKVVIWVGARDNERERFIFVFARAPVAIARRQRECELLERLGRLPLNISRHVPRPEHQQDIAGARLFVMQEFPGVTLEADVPGLETATGEAADFITRLHVATRVAGRMTPERFEGLCGSMFDAAAARYPVIATDLARLRAAVRGALVGLEIPQVWLHGDFKVENLVVDARTSRLAGVIDWELAEPEGLPFLDLWFLLLYNRTIREAIPFFPGVSGVIVPGTLRPDEQALCDRYARALGVPPGAMPALAAMLMVHHCARRMFYDNQDAPMMKRISMAIEEALRQIASGGGRRDA